MALAAQLAIDVLQSARKWVHTRLMLKRLLDSKTATPKQVEKAKQDYNRMAEELVAAVVKLERVLQQSGGKLPTKRSAPLPWKELFGMISTIAKSAETALNPEPVRATVVDAKVIDAEIE